MHAGQCVDAHVLTELEQLMGSPHPALHQHMLLLSSSRLSRAANPQAPSLLGAEGWVQRLRRVADTVVQQRDDCAHVVLQLSQQHMLVEDSNRTLRLRMQSMAHPLREVVAGIMEAKALAKSNGTLAEQQGAATRVQAHNVRSLLREEAQVLMERLAACEERASDAEARTRQAARDHDAALVSAYLDDELHVPSS